MMHNQHAPWRCPACRGIGARLALLVVGGGAILLLASCSTRASSVESAVRRDTPPPVRIERKLSAQDRRAAARAEEKERAVAKREEEARAAAKAVNDRLRARARRTVRGTASRDEKKGAIILDNGAIAKPVKPQVGWWASETENPTDEPDLTRGAPTR